jgi:hypothetical protein
VHRIANIGARGQQRRMRFGTIAFAAAAALAIALVALDAPRVARLTVFLPLWIAGLGVFQARDKT